MNAVFGTGGTSYTNVRTGTVTMSVFVPPKPRQGQRLRALLLEGLSQLKRDGQEIGPAKVSFQRVAQQNWAESWKKHFKPLEIGSKLLVKPPWSRRPARRGQSVVVLNPGLSFGTGQHPTTAFCLEQIVDARVPGKAQSLLDVGTGSGILAIAAAKLGYAPVRAIDFDPECVRVAAANARVNRVQGQVALATADVRQLEMHPGCVYSVVCANLITPLLTEVSSRLLAQLEPGGLLVLAGILKAEFPALRKVYEAFGIKLVAAKARNEWGSGAFRKALAR